MDSQEFIAKALRTENTPEQLPFSKTGLTLLLRLAVKTSDVVDLVKKTLIYGKQLDEAKLANMLHELEGVSAQLRSRHSLARPDDSANGLRDPNMRLLHGAIGMFGEAGEIIEAILAGMLSGELDMVNLAEETGDSDWCKALIHDETGVPEEASRAAVIAKLQKRYPDKFTSEAALNRDLDAERATLETSLGTTGVATGEGIVTSAGPAANETDVNTTASGTNPVIVDAGGSTEGTEPTGGFSAEEREAEKA